MRDLIALTCVLVVGLLFAFIIIKMGERIMNGEE
jgi:hypothetical protein